MHDVLFADNDQTIVFIQTFLKESHIEHRVMQDGNGVQNTFVIAHDSSCRVIVEALLDLGFPFSYKYLNLSV